MLITAGCGVAKGQAKPKGKASIRFDQARSLVHRGKFEEAIKLFDAFLVTHPKHKLASRAVFLQAKSELGRHRTEAAQAGFKNVIHQFPNSEEAKKAEFKLAMIEFLNGNHGIAETRFQAITKAANGPYTPEAAAWEEYFKTIK